MEGKNNQQKIHHDKASSINQQNKIQFQTKVPPSQAKQRVYEPKTTSTNQ